MGRPPKLTAHQKREALNALADGSASQADLARRFNVSQATISSCGDKFSLSVSLLKSAYVHSLDRAARETRRRICRDDALEVDPPPAHDAVDFVVRAGLSGGDNCERRPSRRATRAATEVRSEGEKAR